VITTEYVGVCLCDPKRQFPRRIAVQLSGKAPLAIIRKVPSAQDCCAVYPHTFPFTTNTVSGDPCSVKSYLYIYRSTYPYPPVRIRQSHCCVQDPRATSGSAC